MAIICPELFLWIHSGQNPWTAASLLDSPGIVNMPNVGTGCKQEISQVIILHANYPQCSSLQRKKPLQSWTLPFSFQQFSSDRKRNAMPVLRFPFYLFLPVNYLRTKLKFMVSFGSLLKITLCQLQWKRKGSFEIVFWFIFSLIYKDTGEQWVQFCANKICSGTAV